MTPSPLSSIFEKSLAFTLLFLVPVFMSTNLLVARGAVGIIAPNVLAGQRWLMAGLVFCALSARSLWLHHRLIQAQWRKIFVLGALGMWICGAWVYQAGQTASVANMALIYALSPVCIVMVAAIWLKESVGPWQILGILLAMAGVIHVIVQGQWSQLTHIHWVPGDLWIFAAMLSWTAFSILLKRWPLPVADEARLGVVSLAGVIVTLPFALFEAWFSPLPFFSWDGFKWSLLAALVPGFLAYWSYSALIEKLGAARAGVVMYLVPPCSALMAWIFLDESIRAYHLLAMLLILPGIFLASRR